MNELKDIPSYAVLILHRHRHGFSAFAHLGRLLGTSVAVLALLSLSACASHSATQVGSPHTGSSASGSESVPSSMKSDMARTAAPEPQLSGRQQAAQRARARTANMSIQDQAAQLVMVPLQAGTPPTAIRQDIKGRHIGSVLLFGNSTAGIDAVHEEISEIQSYADDGDGLLFATDQEGGTVQHLKGPGFSAMPSAVVQGQMSADSLESNAKTWGAQLRSAGINVDFAPSVDTVQTQPRSANAAIGALNRDFGLDASGNALHARAFIEGMSQAGISTAIKHYPGLGAVAGNTDLTNSGITDGTTTLDGEEISAFDEALKSDPAMVMMSLATYSKIDPGNPAAFSSTIMQGHLRDDKKYQGIIVSDSLSAQALADIPANDLGVRFIQAGGDLICADAPGYIDRILDGIIATAQSDTAFRQKVADSATRVLTLKYERQLIR
ncbi:glycoside hydrolase family 3 N-terminal domain-containing protein [Bifidobacterium sp.]|uniref:glycoside hydrolase family 3 N-terminal domain-containing protein n=2 Tax=Bifidobacterium sp. TaxID=41200 RepID=UPI0039E8A351